MNFGLEPAAMELITQTLGKQPKLRRAVLFGSRVKGTHSPGSDIDIAVWGLGSLGAESLREELDELPLPYTFNVLAYEEISHGPLQQHVDRVGRTLFPSEPSDRQT